MMGSDTTGSRTVCNLETRLPALGVVLWTLAVSGLAWHPHFERSLTTLSTEITLKNGVWVHETEWAAIQHVLAHVEKIVAHYNAAYPDLSDAFWCWKHAELDIEDQARTIRSLTNLLSELTPDDEDGSVTDMV